MVQYIWHVRARLPERYRTPCRVLARGRLNTCLVEFEDGFRVTTSRNYLARLDTLQKRHATGSVGPQNDQKARLLDSKPSER